jgi:hypothetical protein
MEMGGRVGLGWGAGMGRSSFELPVVSAGGKERRREHALVKQHVNKQDVVVLCGCGQ